MTQPDDHTLMAYVDGELDADGASEVERAIAEDARVAQKVRAFRESARLVRAAFEDSREQPDMQTPPPPVRKWRFALPLAASLAGVAIGLGGSYLAREYNTVLRHEVATTDMWIDETVTYYRIYAEDDPHLVEIGADESAHIETWFGKRLRRELRVPDLSRQGLTFRGARFMAVEGQPAGLLVYDTADGTPFGICITFTWLKGEQAPRPLRRSGTNIVYWADANYAYVLMGAVRGELLQSLVPVLARQLESS